MSNLPPPPPMPGIPFWDRTVLGVPMKWALPIGGVAVIGGVLFFLWYRSKSSANASATSSQPNTSSTLSVPGSQLAAAGLVPYYGTGGPVGSGAVSGGTYTTRGDSSYGTGTIPVVSSPNPSGAGDTITQLPETTALQSLGVTITSPTPVSGTWPGEGSRQFYSVTLPNGTPGYILTQDLQLTPNPAASSAYYSGPTSLPSGQYPSTYQQTGSSTPSYPYTTGFD